MSLPETFKAYIIPKKGEKPKLTTVPLEKPGQNKIVIKMEFTPINPADVMLTEGKYPVDADPPHGVGMEGSGVVAAVGENLAVQHKVGDRVHVMGLGTFGEYVVTSSEQCRKVQEGLDMKDAACHIVNPGIVHCMAHTVEKGEHKAAVHTASSSTLGKMMIRYFKHKGIKLINIVRREEVIEELKREGAEIVLNSKSPNFEKELREITTKESATICFDPIVGEMSAKVLRNMPDNTAMYIYGALSSDKLNDFNVDDFIFKNKSVNGLWLNVYMKELEKTKQVEKVLKEIDELLPTIFKTKIEKVFPLTEIEQGFEFNSKSSSKGKTLIQSS